ncbi:MAG: ABC transporter permease [Bacteroidia bacterium]
MLLRIAWRNIWRNKLRSLVLALSIVIGLWAGMFIMSFSWGMYKEHVHDVIENQLSNIQIHHPSFQEDEMVDYTISNGESISERLKKDPRVKGVSARNIAGGMISSPTYASGVNIFGIKPDEEKNVTTILTSVSKGNYFTDSKKNEILIGEKLAEKLGVKIKNKVVLTFQQIGGEITSGAFRIVGMFRTKNSMLDESVVYVRFQDLGHLLGTGDEIHELAILLKDDAFTQNMTQELSVFYPKLKVETWKQLAPFLKIVIDSFNQYMYIFIAIILLALMFGIVNTMLMAVLERQHEFGMLMAIGMNKPKVFSMVVLETIMLTSIGIPLGILLTYITVGYFNKHGIDLSVFSEGMARLGFANVIHPDLESSYYLPISLMTAGSSVLSALYPAYKALKLKPAAAIRKI